jgi:hypothetical protein
MQIRKPMDTRALPFLALVVSFAMAGAATTLAGCSSTESNSNSQSGGASSTEPGAEGGASTTASARGGASNSSVAATGSATATGGATATGPGVWAVLNVNMIPAAGESEAYATAEGFGKDSAPLPELFKTTATSGACKLLEPTYPLCDPKCADGNTCIGEDQCAHTPAAVDMGSLVFGGLALKSGSGDLTVAPINKTYQDSSLAYPPCGPGKDVSVSGGADASTKFTLKAQCIDPIEITGADPLPFKPGEAAQITWKAPTVTLTNSRMLVRIDISHHGGLKGLIVCDTADTGSVSVDGQLISKLVQLGTAGFPVAKLTRVSTGTGAAGAGTATLTVQSAKERDLEIPGVVSCTTEKPCPSPQVCKAYKCEAG